MVGGGGGWCLVVVVVVVAGQYFETDIQTINEYTAFINYANAFFLKKQIFMAPDKHC